MRIVWLSGILTLIAGLAVPGWAASSATPSQPLCPFSEQGLAHLSLTAAQSRQAHRIAQGLQHSLQVPVYDATQRPDGQFAGVPIGWIPIEEAIRQHRAELTALLAAPRPDAIAAQQVAREIAVQELILKETVAAGLTALETILTPEQRAQLMPCPLQNGLPG